MTKWLGGRGGGPSFISSNDQWYPYWTNGNVPLVSLLRAAGALNRLPADLSLDEIIDGGMRHVLETAEPAAGFSFTTGALLAGDGLERRNLTVDLAMAHCEATSACAGFTYEGGGNATGAVQAYFKSVARGPNGDAGWSSYTRQPGWVNGHLLSEGGTQIVQSLTQWAEDRGEAEQRAVARVTIAHLLALAKSAISAQSVTSWAAIRWPSVATLLEYALDVSLPRFGADKAVAPPGAAEALLEAAHALGRLGFDFEAYYDPRVPPNPRSANKSLPNGSVPLWNGAAPRAATHRSGWRFVVTFATF